MNLFQTTPLFLHLPQEILDEILSQVDKHQDLISLALASHACCRIVIPRHSEYRIIRVRHSYPAVWAHLARRADLARNIREVHICEPNNHLSPDHLPISMVPDLRTYVVKNIADETIRIANIVKALGYMSDLRKFSWSSPYTDQTRPTLLPHHEDAVLSALTNKPNLEHVALVGRFGFHLRSGSTLNYPVWAISNLRSLFLEGDFWVRPSTLPQVKTMLSFSPNIEFLELPMEISSLTDVKLPCLKTLKLFLQCGGPFSIDKVWVKFIENNPSIESLVWHPIGPIHLFPNALPNIKTLQTNQHLLEALLQGGEKSQRRKIEALDVLMDVFNERILYLLEQIHPMTLHKLRVLELTSGSSECTISMLPEVVPALKWLSLPRTTMSLDDWVALLGGLSSLETFRGPGIWESVEGNKDKMHSVILTLVEKCRRLKRLDHCDYYPHRKDFKKIVIMRRPGHITYAVDRPEPILMFEDTDGNLK